MIRRWFLVHCASFVILLSNNCFIACWRHKISATLVAKYLLGINILKRRQGLDDTAHVAVSRSFIIIIIIIFLNNVWISIYMIFWIPLGPLALLWCPLCKVLPKFAAWGRCCPRGLVNRRTKTAFKELLWQESTVNTPDTSYRFLFLERIAQNTRNLKTKRDI